MKSGIIVPSLVGLSSKEWDIFWKLPWTIGKISDIIDFDKTTFLLLSGRIFITNYGIVGPGEEILGVKPFFKQPSKEYRGDLHHEIYYIDTESLINFFLLYPRAMYSYIRMESNIGSEAIPEWSRIASQWLVVSDAPCYESIHLGLNIAEYQTKNFNTSAIYVEFQSEILSVFNLIRQTPPPGIMQMEDTYESLEKLLASRILKYKENIHILNAQFLSIWPLSYKDWMAIFWILSRQYDDIVIHLGIDKMNDLYEQSNSIFVVTSNNLHTMDAFNHEKNHIEWPPISEIRRQKSTHRSEKNIIEYPLKHMELASKLNSYDISDDYWVWFSNNFEHILNPQKAFVISDYFDNFAGLMAIFHYLWDQSTVETLLPKEIVLILEGQSGILGSVAVQSNNRKEFVSKCKRLVDYDLSSILKPIFPTNSLFSDKPIAKYLTNLFPGLMQDPLKIYFPVITQDTKDIHFLTSGRVSDNLIKSTFTSGFVDTREVTQKLEVDVRSLGRTNRNNWGKILANCFRIGFKEVVFINFIQPVNYSKDFISKRLLEDTNIIDIYSGLSGINSQIIQVPYSERLYLNQKEEEIYNKIKLFFNESH